MRSLSAARRGGVALLAVLVVVAVLGLPALAAPGEGVEPARPTGLIGDTDHDAVTLCWDDPADATISGYQILRRDRAQSVSGQFSVHVDNTGTAESSYIDHDVTAGTRYVYRIKARNAHGLSPQSRWFDADTPTTARTDAPAKPSGLTGEVAHDAVALRWDDPCDPTVTGYQILAATAPSTPGACSRSWWTTPATPRRSIWTPPWSPRSGTCTGSRPATPRR